MELLEAKIVSGNSPKQILSALKALSDETRVRILHILSLSPLNVQEITEVLKMGQSRVSRHLKILTDAGFLIPEREGSWVYYRIIEEKKPPLFLPRSLNFFFPTKKIYRFERRIKRRFPRFFPEGIKRIHSILIM